MLRNVMRVADLPNDVLYDLFRSADALRSGVCAVRHRTAQWQPQVVDGCVLATLFFEPSTRTRLSFESAMRRLGGEVISACDSNSLSVSKGESLADTIEAVSYLADVIVVRSTQPLYEWHNSDKFRVPVINAGDGGNNHPTQALLDAYTLWRHNGCSNVHAVPQNKTFGIVGDVEKSRTIRSFIELFSRDQSNQFILFDSTGRGAKFAGTTRYDDIWHATTQEEFEAYMPRMDCLYLNRVQKERHASEVNGSFVLTEKHLMTLKGTCAVLNPGPRREELPVELSHYGSVKMWEQVENGLYVRMALLKYLLAR